MKKKALFILHHSPPVHGASMVGDKIVGSTILNKHFKSNHIKIKSSQKLKEIGKFNFLKIFYLIELAFKVIWQLLFFRPDIIYYTASPSGFAFYRDLIVTFPIKLYSVVKKVNIFFHYHAKGINTFVKSSRIKLILTKFFIKGVNLLFISRHMLEETQALNNYKNLCFISNGVVNTLTDLEFEEICKSRIESNNTNILYLSNMIKEKGYDIVLELAKSLKEKKLSNIKFQFAGGWASRRDEKFFQNFVSKHQLQGLISYHGLVQGEGKKELFSRASIFIFPSSYKKEVFPLSVLEALSYGLPVLAFDVGAVAEIVTKKNGIITNKEFILENFNLIKDNYKTKECYENIRLEYLQKYSLEVFENNLLNILKS